MDFSELSKFINSLEGYDNRFSCCLNSITISFYKKDTQADYYFWVDPPWRIRKGTQIIQNSYNFYPFHENYTDEELEGKDFRAWASRTESLRDMKIELVEFSECGDLHVKWEDDYSFDCFVNDMEEPSYYFYDYVNLKAYEISPGKVTVSPLKKRRKRVPKKTNDL